MFEIADGPVCAHPVRSASLSVLIHSIIVLLLFTVRFPAADPVLRTHGLRAVLIAPYLPSHRFTPQPHQTAPSAPPAPHSRLAPKLFDPLPPAPPTPAPKLALPSAPQIEIPRIPEPKIELAKPAVAPPPPLKIDNLDEVKLADVVPHKKSISGESFSSADTAASRAVRGTISASTGFDIKEQPGASRTRGSLVQATAFSQAESIHPVQRAAAIGTAEFGDVSVGQTPARTARSSIAAAADSVEILSKPRPEYTEEGRRMRIEGEVVLEVLFARSGDASVLRVVKGLGHGLDENAIAAARGIRFRPAQHEGAAVDSSAVVHIVFQLAY